MQDVVKIGDIVKFKFPELLEDIKADPNASSFYLGKLGLVIDTYNNHLSIMDSESKRVEPIFYDRVDVVSTALIQSKYV